jgi:hypothetical protein
VDVLARLADQRAIADGFARALERQRDQDAGGDGRQLDAGVLPRVDGVRRVDVHRRSLRQLFDVCREELA